MLPFTFMLLFSLSLLFYMCFLKTSIKSSCGPEKSSLPGLHAWTWTENMPGLNGYLFNWYPLYILEFVMKCQKKKKFLS